jgi:hypothetical protein
MNILTMKKRIICDNVIIIAVFLLTINWLISYLAAIHTDSDFGRTYTNYLFPIFAQIDCMIISIILILKSFLLKTCGFTKVAAVMYLILNTITFTYILFPFKYSVLSSIVLSVMSVGIVLLTFMSVIYLWINYRLKTGRKC